MTAAAAGQQERAGRSTVARAADVLSFEWIKLRSIRSNYITLLAAVTVTLGSTVIVARAVAAAASPPPGGAITALTASFLGYAEYAVIPVSVLAVLQFTSEYGCGYIATTFCAVPRRWAALAGKTAVTGTAALISGELLAFACFWLAQALLAGRHRGLSLAQPGVTGAVLAGGFVLCACALTALGLGAIIRHTAGAITGALAAIYGAAALCLVLPSPWKDDLGRFTMGFAATQIVALHPQRGLLSPAFSMLVLAAWPAAALLIAGLVTARRDV